MAVFVGWSTHVCANTPFLCNFLYLGREGGLYALRVVSWYMNSDILYAFLDGGGLAHLSNHTA